MQKVGKTTFKQFKGAKALTVRKLADFLIQAADAGLVDEHDVFVICSGPDTIRPCAQISIGHATPARNAYRFDPEPKRKRANRVLLIT